MARASVQVLGRGAGGDTTLRSPTEHGWPCTDFKSTAFAESQGRTGPTGHRCSAPAEAPGQATAKRCTQMSKAARNLPRNSRVPGLSGPAPSAPSNSLFTWLRYISGCAIVAALSVTSERRTSWLAATPPSGPVLSVTIAAGLPAYTFLPYGREATSIAFFSAPVMPRLYS